MLRECVYNEGMNTNTATTTTIWISNYVLDAHLDRLYEYDHDSDDYKHNHGMGARIEIIKAGERLSLIELTAPALHDFMEEMAHHLRTDQIRPDLNEATR